MGKSKIFTKEQMLKICEDYFSKEKPGIETLAQKWECGANTINRVIVNSGYALRTISEALKDKKKSIKHKENISKSLEGKFVGENSSMYGKKHTPEAKEKQRKAKLGKICSPGHKEKTKLNHADQWGENNPNWKGGTTPFSKLLRACSQFCQWRLDVFTRDNFTCQECGQKSGYLEAHHIKPLYEIIKNHNIKIIDDALNCKELWDINNGITLCKKCHRKTYNFGCKIFKEKR